MLDATDRQIVKLLQADGRRTNVDIARVLGLSESTVRKRLDRMLAAKEVHIASFVDPALVGYPVRAVIFLTVELNQVEETAAVLREMPEVATLFWLTGEYDLAMWTSFRDDQHLHSFLANRVSRLPGVVRSQTSHILRVEKHAYEWVVPEPSRSTILLVDDDPDFCETVRLVLTANGYEVRTAFSGDEAVRSAIANPPSLVILDVMMDGILDGCNASGRMRAVPELSSTPILVVSSITHSDALSMVPTDQDNLIDNFLSKPVSPDDLLEEVARLLARQA